MANNIFIGGLPYETTGDDLAKLFSSCGKVLSAKIIMDRETGKSKGFGFVEMSTESEAKTALKKLNGSSLGTRKLFLNEARPQEQRPERSFGDKPRSERPASAAESKPGFVERRSGKDRRGQAASGAERRGEAPAPSGEKRWEKKPFEKKPWEKKPWEKKPWAEKKAWGDKKPWENKPAAEGDKKPWERKPAAGEKKPWEKKPWEKKSWEKKPWEKKPGESAAGGEKKWEKKPFEKKSWEKKPWDKKPGDKKPWEKKPGEKKSWEKKPWDKDKRPGGAFTGAKKWAPKKPGGFGPKKWTKKPDAR